MMVGVAVAIVGAAAFKVKPTGCMASWNPPLTKNAIDKDDLDLSQIVAFRNNSSFHASIKIAPMDELELEPEDEESRYHLQENAKQRSYRKENGKKRYFASTRLIT